jgi:hypothetical protein
MSNILHLHPKNPQIWHGLYFISLHDPDNLNEGQAAHKLRLLAKAIRLCFPELELDLDEDSLNVYQPD